MASVSDPHAHRLHFVLVPLLAQGHMIPMIDMAKLLAGHGVIVSLVTTPINASRSTSTIQRAMASGLPIRVLKIPFPCEQVGLPEGCENLDVLPSRDLIRKFYAAMNEVQKPLEEHLQTTNPTPSCIISDKCLPWTSKTAAKFRIPRIVFHGMCCFSLLASHNVKLHKPHLSVSSYTQPFLVPGMPNRVEITTAQLPGSFVTLPDLDDIRGQMQEAESTAYGIVINTFTELEHKCIKRYQNATNKKVWCIGPVSLCNKENSDKFTRGNKASIDEQTCIKWLNSQNPRSVIYACLGSQCRLVPEQLIQLGLALESSGYPFIWVIKTGNQQKTLENWLSNNLFEERNKDKALIIKGWAPQVMILSHPSIRGFLTHCGWNSVIEGISWGIPMITWPQFAEQFFNEKMVVETLEIGVRVGVEIPVRFGDEEKIGVLVKKDEIKGAIFEVMNGDEEGERRRRRAMEIGQMARDAIDEGGSSNIDLLRLIRDIVQESDTTR